MWQMPFPLCLGGFESGPLLSLSSRSGAVRSRADGGGGGREEDAPLAIVAEEQRWRREHRNCTGYSISELLKLIPIWYERYLILVKKGRLISKSLLAVFLHGFEGAIICRLKRFDQYFVGF